MKRDDVIRMAREADIIDFRDEADDQHVAQMVDFLMRFAALVAAAEREACAQECESVDLHDGDFLKDSDPRKTCATAIRARSSA